MYTYVEGAKDYYHCNYGFVLEEGVNPKDVEAEMTRRMKTLDPQFSARLTPLSKKIDEQTGHMSVTRTIVYLISSLILAAALIGFLKMQLQLFRMRQREVALRRVHGASRRSIFRLFACETLLTFLLSGIVAFVLATLLIDFANASLTPYLNEFGWKVDGIYESVAVILCAVALLSLFIVWLTVRTMVRQRQSMAMQLHRSRGHTLRNTMLGIQIAICILFVGGSLALTQFSELTLKDYNVPENDDFYQECILVRPYFTEEEAKRLAETKGETYHCDAKRGGWRKVVASPKPIAVHNVELVKQLADGGNVVVAVGGGGVAVVNKEGKWQGLEAVIDKDLALATTAVAVGADEFYILTDIEKVCLNFNTPEERKLDRITVAEAKQYLAEGHFAEGSMAPKIRAAIHYIEAGGKVCIITDATELHNPSCGTRIVAE